MLLLHLKALVWTVYVAGGRPMAEQIASVLRLGEIPDTLAQVRDTHLGDVLRQVLAKITDIEDRERLAAALEKTPNSQASVIYRNMVIEVGHYVTAQQVEGVPVDCYGVVYHIGEKEVSVLFRTVDRTLLDRQVRSFEVIPVYTLTISETDA